MEAAALSPEEMSRVAALYDLGFDGAGHDERFERAARIAARVLDVPVAVVNMIDRDRQWGKACVGLASTDMPRAHSFCSETIRSDDPLVIPDVAAEPAFALQAEHNPGVAAYLGHPVHDPTGQRIGTLCVVDHVPRDWTDQEIERLRDIAVWVDLEIGRASLIDAVKRRRMADSRLQAVFDSAVEGIVALDEEGRVMLTNPAAVQMLGRAADDLRGKVFHEVAHHSHVDGSTYPIADCPTHHTLATGVSHRLLEEVYWHRDGTPVPVDLSSTPILDGSRVIGAVVVFRDAAERRELERMKRDFISTVSHELRTPLTVITGYVDGVLEEDEGTLTSEQREDLEIVQRNAGRLHSLVDDLLLLSRIQAGRLEFQLEPVDLHVLVGELLEDLAPVARAKDLRFELELEPAATVGDRARLQQCAANLLSNALKFGRPGTAVRVRTAMRGAAAVVEVIDRGPGIPPAEVESLGQRFFRASTARAVEGTGLGLTITREIVDRHGGHLEVESTLGEGSAFRVVLPDRAAG